jgi:hypothetical protein
MISFGIGIVVKAIVKEDRQSAKLKPRMIRWYVVFIPLIDRSTMEIIIIEERKEIEPVTIGMIMSVFVNRSESSLRVSDMMMFLLFFGIED